MLIYTKVYGYIGLQGFHDRIGDVCHHDGGSGLGVGHPPCKFVSSMVEI